MGLTATDLVFASPWKRVFAYVLDWLVALVGGLPIVLILAWIRHGLFGLPMEVHHWNGLGVLVVWLYIALMESSTKQATLGQLAMGIKVTDLSGNRITFWRATGRFFGTLLSSVILMGGFIMILFTQKRQGLHDMIAGCLVLAARSPIASQVTRAGEGSLARSVGAYSSATASLISGSASDTSQVAPASNNDAIYAAIAVEFETGSTDKGLWTRLFAECDGDENKTKAAYIRRRCEQLTTSTIHGAGPLTSLPLQEAQDNCEQGISAVTQSLLPVTGASLPSSSSRRALPVISAILLIVLILVIIQWGPKKPLGLSESTGSGSMRAAPGASEEKNYTTTIKDAQRQHEQALISELKGGGWTHPTSGKVIQLPSGWSFGSLETKTPFYRFYRGTVKSILSHNMEFWYVDHSIDRVRSNDLGMKKIKIGSWQVQFGGENNLYAMVNFTNSRDGFWVLKLSARDGIMSEQCELALSLIQATGLALDLNSRRLVFGNYCGV